VKSQKRNQGGKFEKVKVRYPRDDEREKLPEMGLACSDAKIYRTGDTKQRK
jgi:hypothetical protein